MQHVAVADQIDHMHDPDTFITKYIYSQDHKVIAIQYSLTAVFVGLVALVLSGLMRLQLGFPDAFDFIEPYAGSQIRMELDQGQYSADYEAVTIPTSEGEKTVDWPIRVLPTDEKARAIAKEFLAHRPEAIAAFSKKFEKEYDWTQKLPAPVIALIVFHT